MQPQEISKRGLQLNPNLVAPALSQSFSLFALTHGLHEGAVFANHKTSLRAISHEIEHGIHSAQSPVRLFAGFQLLSRFLPQIDRYRAIAAIVDEVWVMGVPDVEAPHIPGITFIALTPRHVLAKEWFLIVNSADYFTALVAEELEHLDPSEPDNTLYRGIWSFNETLVSHLEQHLQAELMLHQDHQITRDYQGQLDTIGAIANNLVQRLELRNQALIDQRRQHDEAIHLLIHDLRSSLTGVIGSLQLLSSGRVVDELERQAMINNSLQNSMRLAQMLSNQLDINKIENGALLPSYAPINLRELVFQAAARWQDVAIWNDKQIIPDIPDMLPVMIGDAHLLERVLDNLINNALKYGNTATVKVRASRSQAIIEIADDGPGIEPVNRKVIFDKYTQTGSQEMRRKGTGLGLHFCKLAIEAHHGIIEADAVRTRRGESGALFRITLPLFPPRRA